MLNAFLSGFPAVMRRCGLLAVVALTCAVPTGPAVGATPAVQSGRACTIEFTGMSGVVYNAELDLTGLIVMGHHNYSPATRSGGAGSEEFEVLDTDGFLTLYILLNQWQASGQLERNLTEPVDYHRSDVELAAEVVGMGLQYHHVLVERIAVSRPANYTAVRRLLAFKIEGLVSIQEGLERALRQSGDQIELPPGFISARMGLLLDGLTGPDQFMMAQYRDPASSESAVVLCQDGGSSTFVSQLLCGHRFRSASPRDPAICPEGLRLNRLASLPFCRRVNGADVCA